MPKQDSEEFRGLIYRLLPGLRITAVASPSGQRIVYFGDFSHASEEELKIWRKSKIDVKAWGDVVIKLSSGISPASITYLQREIRVLSDLDSAHFPQMFHDDVFSTDPGTDELLDERLFVTIEEFVPSTPLSECLEKFETEEAVVDLLIELTEALLMLWSQRPALVHRDLKPENILIKNDGTVVVIDLGIVREEGRTGVTATEAMWGPCTPHFSSPEQARNDKMNITCKSDFFAVGTLAYFLITKVNPFYPDDSATMVDVLYNVVNIEPSCLADTSGCSSIFSDLIHQMMHKEPYRRPRTPDLLLKSLKAVKESNDGN